MITTKRDEWVGGLLGGGLLGGVLALASLSGCLPADDTNADEIDGEGEGESETGDELIESLAHDIDIAVVEVNQGVAIPVAVDGEWVGPDQRNATIVRDRAGLVRVYWTLAPEFEPREIEARLTLVGPGGEPRVLSEIMPITGASQVANLSGSFSFELDAGELVPGTSFSAALYEVDPEFAELPPSSVEPISPRDGLAELGVQPEAAQMKIVLIPIEQEFAGCSTKVDVDMILPSLAQTMLMVNPLQTLELAVHEPMVLSTPAASLSEILARVQQLRSGEQPADNVYYHGILVHCDYQLEATWPGGLATLVDDAQPESSWMRASVGAQAVWDLDWTLKNFAHEIGHLQGLAHVECPSDVEAENPDPTYPYADGLVGVWGYGLLSHVLHDPAIAHDYMSYCEEGFWTSDWTWTKNFRRIASLTSWDTQDQQAPAADRTLLVGWVGDEGRREWWTVRGRIPSAMATALDRPRTSRDGLEFDLPTRRNRVPDGQADLIAVELPELIPDRLEVDGVPVPADVLALARGE